MNYLSLSHYGRDLLKASKCENAAFDAMCLLEFCTQLNRTQIISRFENQVKDETVHQYKTILARRVSGEPLQYILGKWEFMGLDFFVGPGVLIPRPETEMLVELAVNELAYRNESVVFDLCAGTGCIGISIAKICKNAQVYLLEKFPQAFEYLKTNLESYCLDNATAICCDISEGFSAFGLPQPDIILSNPPYIPTAQMACLQSEVLHEPQQALDGGPDGLDFYTSLKELWFPNIKAGGLMVIECGEDQAGRISNSFLQKSDKVVIRNDFNGIARTVIVYAN